MSSKEILNRAMSLSVSAKLTTKFFQGKLRFRSTPNFCGYINVILEGGFFRLSCTI